MLYHHFTQSICTVTTTDYIMKFDCQKTYCFKPKIMLKAEYHRVTDTNIRL